MSTYRSVKRRYGGTATGAAVAIIIAGFIAGFLCSAFVIMVLWGALGLTLGFQTIGFGTAMLVSLSLGVVAGYFRNFK